MVDKKKERSTLAGVSEFLKPFPSRTKSSSSSPSSLLVLRVLPSPLSIDSNLLLPLFSLFLNCPSSEDVGHGFSLSMSIDKRRAEAASPASPSPQARPEEIDSHLCWF